MMMLTQSDDARLFQLFSELLDYPRAGLAGPAAESAALAEPRSEEAAQLLREFAAFAERTSPARMEEIYTGVFELDATCHPYVGYHLFGESYKRSVLLLGLKERYRLYDVQCGVELEDHLAMMLRFLAASDEPEQTREVMQVAILPALRKMIKGNPDEEPPEPDIPRHTSPGDEYRGLLRALQLIVAEEEPEEDPVGLEIELVGT